MIFHNNFNNSGKKPDSASNLLYLQFTIMLAAILIVGVAAFFSIKAINETINDGATTKALVWSESMLRSGEVDIARVLGGEALDDGEIANLQAVADVATVRQFRIYNEVGTLLFSSEVDDTRGKAHLLASDAAIVKRARNGEVVARAPNVAPVRLLPPASLSTYLPIELDDAFRGILEVYVDVTAERTVALNLYRWLAGLFVLAAALIATHALLTAHIYRKRRRADAAVEHLVHFDPLTGIANRAVFNDALHGRLDGTANGKRHFALHLIDIDGFKTVNDMLGHLGADRLLHSIAEIVGSSVRPTDLVARLAGDEFGIIQHDVATPADATAFAERILQTIREIRLMTNVPVDVTASVGTAIAPVDATDAINLHRCADAALARAKEAGRDRVVLYQYGMNETVRHRNVLRQLVRQALEKNTFEVYYQPIHGLSDGRLAGMESLLRLKDTDGKFVSPAEFIPIAESIGVMDRLGALVLWTACHDAATWSRPIKIGVNLSAQQFAGYVVGTVTEALASSGLSPQRLVLEITESMFISDADAVEAQLKELRALGCFISLDDFGTGYSSLSYLWKLSFDALKVDRSCISLVDEVQHVDTVLRTIASMCKTMNLDVIAEGIETEAQLQFARDAGYTHGQGFLFGKPMPASDVPAYIAAMANGYPGLSPTNPPLAPQADA